MPGSGSFTANASWASGVVTVKTDSAHGFVTGAWVDISGFTPAGYNGTYEVTVTGTDTFTYALPTDPGVQTLAGTAAASGGALPVRILQVYTSNARVVEYDETLNVTRWNNAGDNDAVAVLVEI